MPDKATRVRETVSGFAPDDNMVDLASGQRVTYDFRGVDLDLQIDWDAIESPADTLGPKKAWGQIIAKVPSVPHVFARGLNCGA